MTIDIIKKEKTVLFENKFFRSEIMEDGTRVITVLKDENKFFGINLEGCKFITNRYGYIDDEFTVSSELDILEKFGESYKDGKYSERLKIELRNRTMNVLMHQVVAQM